jgi:hypothetical protein
VRTNRLRIAIGSLISVFSLGAIGATAGDLNGDRKADLLWFNAATGQTAYWLMDGATTINGGVLLTHPRWKVIGTGDLNGDGKADLVWYNADTGQTAYWLMSGATATAGGVLRTDPDWRVAAIGDLNGDGKADLIWFNPATGQTAYWLMDGATSTGNGVLLTHPNWRVAHTADLNGDGKSDLIWYNAATGQTAYWLMNGPTAIASGVLLGDPSWRVAAVGDLNGDGKADLIWSNPATGQTAYWLMDGATTIGGGVLLTHPSWKVIGTSDLNGDGKADLVWYNADTGQTAYWMMNGAVATRTGLLLTDARWTTAKPALGEALPSNLAPEAGSTTATGSAAEGLWISPAGSSQGLAFVDATGKYVGFWPGSATLLPLLFEAGLNVSGSNWSFADPSFYFAISGGIPFSSGVYGGGSFTPHVQVQGTYTLVSPSGTSTPFSLEYSVGNALAVTSADVVGRWGTGEIALEVDANGALTGTAGGAGFNACAVSGLVTHAAGNLKNIYSVSMTLVDVTPGSCFADKQHGAYQGYAAITFADIGGSGAPIYVRRFTVLARTSFHIWFASELARR